MGPNDREEVTLQPESFGLSVDIAVFHASW